MDLVWTGLLIGWFVQRFGQILFDPVLLFQDSFRAIMAVPAPYMALVGWIAGGLFVGWKMWRAKLVSETNFLQLLNAFVPGILIGLGVSQLLMVDLGKPTLLPWGVMAGNHAYHPLHFYRGLALVLLGMGIRRRSVPTVQRLGWSLFGVGVIGILVSFLDFPNRQWMGMSTVQAGSLVLAVFGLLLLWRKRL
ncbi:prolipoprotein diacylglyceryl transferase [Effusibacillus pohliae]|uniref:hypothetical protein n=1 Tax=Effusibacillus pohliae TaxID=232270 RepID=UPI001B7FD486|nr:hypothetical protein [Effusibacillus pohliae]